MALSDITAILRRINLRNTSTFDAQWKIQSICNVRIRCFSSLAPRLSFVGSNNLSSGGWSAIPGMSPGRRPDEHAASVTRLPLSASCSRGLASKAHMKYGKRKKAPVDRFVGLDPAQPRLGFEKVKELETANENVKKIFSLEFGSGTDIRLVKRKMAEDLVRDKPDEKDDLAVKIANITEHIKALAPHVESNKKDSVNKVRMLHAIDRRGKMLKYLRKRDYDRFQRLLEELNITWTPQPMYPRRLSRRALEKKTVCQEAYAKRKQALEEFEAKWRQERLLEIAMLKEELGKELGEEEREILQRSREESSV